MKFHIELVSKGSGRLGALQRLEKGSGEVIKTPALIMTTKSGSVPYLSKDVFDMIMPAAEQGSQILGVNIQSTFEMSDSLKHFQRGISDFVGLGNIPSLVHLNDCSVMSRLQHNEASGIPVFAKSGKKVLTPQSFIEMIDSFRPEAVVLMGDTNLSMDVGKNRSRKSVSKTMEFIDKCLELKTGKESLGKSMLLAPIAGAAKDYDRNEFLTYLNQLEAIDGYSIEGLHKMGPDALLGDQDLLLDTVKIILEKLKTDKLKLMLGAYSPLMVIDLITAGVDLFDNTLAFLCVETQRALVFNFDVTKMDHNTEGLFSHLAVKENKEDFNPILKECSCLACKNHTLAYIRHLFDAKELLGSILLAIHNFHHYNEFFKAIRRHVEQDALAELRELIASQSKDTNFEKEFANISEGNINKSDGMLIANKS